MLIPSFLCFSVEIFLPWPGNETRNSWENKYQPLNKERQRKRKVTEKECHQLNIKLQGKIVTQTYVYMKKIKNQERKKQTCIIKLGFPSQNFEGERLVYLHRIWRERVRVRIVISVSENSRLIGKYEDVGNC